MTPPAGAVLQSNGTSVRPHAQGGTLLAVESQSEWVLMRPVGETIPRGVHEVDVTDGWPGKPPFLARRVTGNAQVRRLVALFDSLERLQPVAINCPSYSITPVVRVEFRAATTSRPVAEASVTSVARFSWPANAGEWACFPITFTVRGRHFSPLAGNVITPIQRLLGIKLASR